MEYPCVEHTWHNCRLTTIHKSRIDSPQTVPASSPRIEYINLYVKCKTITENFVVDQQHVLHHMSTSIHSRRNKIVLPVTEKGDIDLDALKNIDTEHNGWPLPNSNCRPRLVKTILNTVRDRVQVVSRLIHYNIGLDIICEVVIKQYHITGAASDVADWMMQWSLEESVPKMVPASDSSIKSLMRAIIVGVGDDDGGCERCSICFEDFLAGSEVSCMPCSHVYHGDCIGEWLRTSHLLPELQI